MTDLVPLRIGLIGYGMAGRSIHARLIKEAGLSARAVVVRDPGRVAAAREDWPGIEVFDDVEAMLNRGGTLDVVVVASPSGLHEEHALQVIAARTAVVLDKPIAADADGALRIIEAAEAGGIPLTVFQNRRWDEEQLTLRSVLAAGDLGRVHRFERRWERWRPTPKDRWKENDPVGGGLLLDLGSHLVDSAVSCFGPVTSVYAEIRSLTTPADDEIFLSLQHAEPAPDDDGLVASGVVSHLSAGSLVGAPGPRTRVLGSRGAFVVTSFEDEPTPFTVVGDRAPGGSLGWLTHGSETTPVAQAPGGHADFYRAMVSWLTVDGPAPVAARDALRTAVVLDSARISATEGRRVTVPEPPPPPTIEPV